MIDYYNLCSLARGRGRRPGGPSAIGAVPFRTPVGKPERAALSVHELAEFPRRDAGDFFEIAVEGDNLAVSHLHAYLVDFIPRKRCQQLHCLFDPDFTQVIIKILARQFFEQAAEITLTEIGGSYSGIRFGVLLHAQSTIFRKSGSNSFMTGATSFLNI